VSRDELTIVLVYPDALGTYGDRGNALAVRHRALGHGMSCRIVEVGLRDAIPRSGDVYLLGGGEDASMLVAWEHLRHDRGLPAAVEAGAACFAVCAGYQLLAERFADQSGTGRPGLGVLDVRCGRLPGPRAVGEVLAEPLGMPGIGFLTGFENHQGDASLGPAARPLGTLDVGVGNGDRKSEGAVQGRVVGTYLHGPALVRNSGLADRLLESVAGPLAPYDDDRVERLREERRRAALGGRRRVSPRQAA